MKYPLNRQSSSGFTIIELLVVLTITGILAAIAVPAGMSTYYRSQLLAFQREVEETVRRAGTNAKRYGEDWGVQIVPEGNRLVLEVAPIAGGGGPETLETSGGARCNRKPCTRALLPRSVEVYTNNFSNDVITFNSFGELEELNNRTIGFRTTWNPPLGPIPPVCLRNTTIFGGFRDLEGAACP